MLELIAAFVSIAMLGGIVKPFFKGWYRGHFAAAWLGSLALFGVIGAVSRRQQATAAQPAETSIATTRSGQGAAAEATKAAIAQTDKKVRSKLGDGLKLIPEYSRSEFPDMYKDVGNKTFAEMADLQRGAVYAATESNACDTVTESGPSDRSAKNAALFYVDCKNGNRFMVHQASAEAALARAKGNTLKAVDLNADCTDTTVMKCLASDAQKGVDQAAVASVCDTTVEKALIGSSSMGWSWDFSYGNGDEVEIDRDFKAENAFGAKLKHRYFCTVDAKAKKIVKLVIQGPFGSQRIV